jgi:diguanylate cyclase (GGDEF)-like protein
MVAVAAQLTQPTLGLLRRILDQMQPILTPYEERKFWRDVLFDFGFPQRVIEIAATYDFQWGEIIPALFVGNFGPKNTYTMSNSLAPYLCEQRLKRLIAFAVDENRGTALADQLRQSLISDGFPLEDPQGVDSSVPAELEQIPGKNLLISDLQQRLDAQELVAVLFMDLDGFKAVNDTLNHAEGDKCLIRIARLIGAAILSKGKLYRPGGDEFVAVLPNFTREEAAGTAERIRSAIDDDNPGDPLKVTVSICVADSDLPRATDAQALITLADGTMYRAKETKNHVAVADRARSA